MAEVTAISWADATLSWVRIAPKLDLVSEAMTSLAKGYAVTNIESQRREMCKGQDVVSIQIPAPIISAVTTRKCVSKKHIIAPAFQFGRQSKPAALHPSTVDKPRGSVTAWRAAWREDLWQLLRETLNLRWILLTKRIGNARKMLPPDWPFPNAGLMSTLENQEVWDRDYHKLADTPAIWHGVSAEPLLGRINIGDARPDWIITGGESGGGFRPLDMDAVRSLRDQCARNGITFHHKQNGGTRGKDAGCLVDGVEHKDFPAALAA